MFQRHLHYANDCICTRLCYNDKLEKVQIYYRYPYWAIHLKIMLTNACISNSVCQLLTVTSYLKNFAFHVTPYLLLKRKSETTAGVMIQMHQCLFHLPRYVGRANTRSSSNAENSRLEAQSLAAKFVVVTQPSAENRQEITTLKLCQHSTTMSMLNVDVYMVTCEGSRFDWNWTIPIRFESDGPIRNFRISRTCCRTTNHAHCSTKKLQPLRRCN